jgi:glycosyltransferase involved in cell wall biosynthesis
LKVLIHAVAMYKQGGGSRHLQGFINALSGLDSEIEYVLYLDHRFPSESSYPNIQIRRLIARSQVHRLWWDQIILPRIVKREGIDLVLAIFVFGSIAPPCSQIVFERNSLFFCREFLKKTPFWSSFRFKVWLRRRLSYLTMRASRIILVPSIAMMEMIQSFYPGIPGGRFVVIPHAFELRHFVTTQPLHNDLRAKIDSVSSNIPKLLYVSHLEPHKGFDILFSAAKWLVQKKVDFCLFTTMDPRDAKVELNRLKTFIRSSGLSDRVINLGRVSEDQVHHLYCAADIFVFPSLCESFGFPMKEALAMGLPIVAADTAINREICGQSAVYYPPHNYVAMAEAIQTLIESPEKRTRLRQLAIDQFTSTTIDWKTYAAKVLDLMRGTVSIKSKQ